MTTKPKKLSRLKSTADLEKEILEEEEAKDAAVEKASNSLGNTPYTEKEVKAALLNCGKSMERRTEKYIVESDFELKDNMLTLFLVNSTLMELFHELKQEILDFIRKDIGNDSLQISAILTAEKKEAKPRTEQEKFKAMLEKNPALKNFKDELGLDLVY